MVFIVVRPVMSTGDSVKKINSTNLKDLKQEKELIKRILSGKASAEEQRQLGRLMKQPGFRALFNTVLDEQGGELEMELDEQAQAFTNEKLELFHQQLPQEGREAPVITMRRPHMEKAVALCCSCCSSRERFIILVSE